MTAKQPGGALTVPALVEATALINRLADGTFQDLCMRLRGRALRNTLAPGTMGLQRDENRAGSRRGHHSLAAAAHRHLGAAH